jgi:hypothetical protein
MDEAGLFAAEGRNRVLDVLLGMISSAAARF